MVLWSSILKTCLVEPVASGSERSHDAEYAKPD
jgi:hypothetical protein